MLTRRIISTRTSFVPIRRHRARPEIHFPFLQMHQPVRAGVRFLRIVKEAGRSLDMQADRGVNRYVLIQPRKSFGVIGTRSNFQVVLVRLS